MFHVMVLNPNKQQCRKGAALQWQKGFLSTA